MGGERDVHRLAVHPGSAMADHEVVNTKCDGSQPRAGDLPAGQSGGTAARVAGRGAMCSEKHAVIVGNAVGPGRRIAASRRRRRDGITTAAATARPVGGRGTARRNEVGTATAASDIDGYAAHPRTGRDQYRPARATAAAAVVADGAVGIAAVGIEGGGARQAAGTDHDLAAT